MQKKETVSLIVWCVVHISIYSHPGVDRIYGQKSKKQKDTGNVLDWFIFYLLQDGCIDCMDSIYIYFINCYIHKF